MSQIPQRSDNPDDKLRALRDALQDYGFHAQVYLSKLRGWTPGKDHVSVKACLDAPVDSDETRAMMAIYRYYKATAAYIS